MPITYVLDGLILSYSSGTFCFLTLFFSLCLSLGNFCWSIFRLTDPPTVSGTLRSPLKAFCISLTVFLFFPYHFRCVFHLSDAVFLCLCLLSIFSMKYFSI